MGYFYTISYRQSWADFLWANLKTSKYRRAQCRYFHDCLGPEASASNLLVLFYFCTWANKLQGLVDLSCVALSLCYSLCSALDVLFACAQLILLAAYQIDDWNSIEGVVSWLQAGDASDSESDKALGNQGGWYPCLSHSMISPCFRACCLFSPRFCVFTLLFGCTSEWGLHSDKFNIQLLVWVSKGPSSASRLEGVTHLVRVTRCICLLAPSVYFQGDGW